jgi:vancomycin resistance protein YoaR
MNLASLRRPPVLVLVGVVLVGTLAGGVTVWAGRYEGRIAPGVSIGNHPFDGQDPEVARQWIQSQVDTLMTQGVQVRVNGNQARVPLSQMVGGDSLDIVSFDVDAAVRSLEETHHDDGLFGDTLAIFGGLFNRKSIIIPVTIRSGVLEEAVRATFPDTEQPPQEPTFQFSSSVVTVVPGASGESFAFDPFLVRLTNHLQTLTVGTVPLDLIAGEPTVSQAVAENQVAAAQTAVQQPAFTITGMDIYQKEASWKLTTVDLKTMLRPGADGLEIDAVAFNTFVNTFTVEVEVAPQNARFEIVDGRAKEFAMSKDGVSIDREATRLALVSAIRNNTPTLALVTVTAEPTVTTAQGNDLGIEGVLGVGVSKFKGSPANRIKNIKNGVSLLNGLLIAPEETFSVLNALKPFETSHGYFPELVIKGDKIEPEVGGGLCQIGTTTFRAAMLSGLPIVSRSNHSLVVSYYNDLSNGNPGTDATIYDPAPDFQFKNDTGHYILFQAELFEDSQELHFTLWGTSDGRKGSYTPPEVIRWIGVGETRITETDTLEPGVKKCQSAHVGADTTFTYSVVRTDGTQEDVVFDSHYRPLPEICLVGATAPAEPTEPETTSSDPTTDVTPLTE